MLTISKYSRIGSYHRSNNTDNQDAILSANNRYYSVISLADGVSTCQESKIGAKIACEISTNFITKYAKYLMSYDESDISNSILENVQFSLQSKANESQINIEEYSSTLASVLYDKVAKKIMFFNLGDSLILGTQGGECRVISKPFDSKDGCCVTTTENAETYVSTSIIDASNIDSVVICSDGAWSQMYNKNRLKNEVAEILQRKDFDALKKYFESCENFDDCSFVSINILS